jgi:carbamoyl-phosphate synthase large subunit
MDASMMNGERVFLSGGAGVIGRELVHRLVARGAEVLIGDLKPRPNDFPTSVSYRQGDLNHLTMAELEAFAPTVFIHLAATFERSTETYGFWEENFWHNLRLSHHLMSLHRDLASLKRVVFASSYLIYEPSLYQFDAPRDAAVALKETDPILPRNLTGMAKLAHEIELRYLESFRGDVFSSVSARIYRGYGRHSRDVISRWIRMALAGETLTVFRPEGRFDYIYAADTAEGLIRLAEARHVTGIINLGTGRSRSVSDVLGVLRTHFPELKTVEGKTDIPFEASCADMTLYEREIGWRPVSDLEQGIKEMLDYEKARLDERPPQRLRNVLVGSAGRKIPLVRTVVEAARKLHPEIRVYAGDLDPSAPAQYVADGFLLLPLTEDANLEEIRNLCISHDIGTVIPTRDGELDFWARNAPEFAQANIEIIVSHPDAVQVSVDKLRFSEHGLDVGLPVIPAWKQPQGAGPFVVKERFGAGSRSIGLDLAAGPASAHAKCLTNPIFQPFVRGTEISVDAWIDRAHHVKGLVMRTRDRVLNGESTVTTTFRDVELESVCRSLLESLPLRGPVVLQLIRDAEGRPHIIELNARFGGASTTSITAGLDIWYWTLFEAGGGNTDDLIFRRVTGEIRQIRVPSDLHLHDSNF